MANTVVVGVSFVDIKGFPFGRYNPAGRNLGSVQVVHGGVSRNVVENFANLGMPVTFASMLEDSAFGRDVARRLRGAGADLSHMLTVEDNGLGMWLVVLDEKGSLAGSISRMPDTSQLEDFLLENGEQIIAEAENVVLEIDLSERIARHVLDMAQRHGKKVYAIVGNMSVILAHPEFLRRTDCFICNEIEAGRLFASEAVPAFSPEQMLEYLPVAARTAGIPSMVVTMGVNGAVYYDGADGSAGICPPYPATVVDTSGAGDAFFSGTVMGLTRHLPLREALRYGAKLASLTIESKENSCPVLPDFFSEQLSFL
ncbi:MAG: carbohydrate kinase family protein [Ruminococcaceae bacterium]|nr:carbohydrate kinase family protein [Oscillospiraceae bacterium]